MTLQRKALIRRTELRRTGWPRRTRERHQRTLRTVEKQQQRHRDTGPTTKVKQLVTDRAAGACEICGKQLLDPTYGWAAPHSFHHRRPRGMGGTTRTDANTPANLLLLCGTGTTGCHGLIEANRADALATGALLPQTVDPTTVPVSLATGWAYLTEDGSYRRSA